MLAILLAAAVVSSGTEPAPAWREALDRISASSLRGHVSFLASDLLEGRNTPSRGLDIAAEYIAAQFRRAGLEASGDDGYFQTANLVEREPNPEGAELAVRGQDAIIRVAPAHLAAICSSPAAIAEAPAIRSDVKDLRKLAAEKTKDKVLILDTPDPSKAGIQTGRIRELAPLAVVLLFHEEAPMQALRRPKLVDPANLPPAAPPVFAAMDPDVARLVKAGGEMTVSAKCGPRLQKPVALRNVVGILHGSDASLKDSAVVVSAHYDHVGISESGEGDRIYNGANDDASGTAAIIEIAGALSALPERPKRSILFAAFFGEELGMLGSQYYVDHPIVPLAKTVANINVEQVGRPWPEDESRKLKAWVTGFEYSGVVRTLQSAGKATGVEVLRDAKNDEEYFAYSDNISFAKKGVPAHTLCTSFYFPDYHEPGDHWDKLDYENMAGVTRMVALGALQIADDPAPPHWNPENKKAEKYRQAAVGQTLPFAQPSINPQRQ